MSKRSQSYIRSFEKYILKVFGLRHFLALLEDNRKAPDIGIQTGSRINPGRI